MVPGLADASESVLLIVDVQPDFLKFVEGSERLRARCLFLAQCASILGIGVYASVQNSNRFGPLDPELTPFLTEPPIEKMCFSAIVESPEIMPWHAFPGQLQVVICGVESHICVSQTAADLIRGGRHTIVCADAVGSRSAERHDLGLRRMSGFGATIAHSEAVVYEWMRTAVHPRFREVLEVVKSYS